jgi:hypothetical protein
MHGIEPLRPKVTARQYSVSAGLAVTRRESAIRARRGGCSRDLHHTLRLVSTYDLAVVGITRGRQHLPTMLIGQTRLCTAYLTPDYTAPIRAGVRLSVTAWLQRLSTLVRKYLRWGSHVCAFQRGSTRPSHLTFFRPDASRSRLARPAAIGPCRTARRT